MKLRIILLVLTASLVLVFSGCKDNDLNIKKIAAAFAKVDTLYAAEMHMDVDVSARNVLNNATSTASMTAHLMLINEENNQLGYYKIAGDSIETEESYYINGYSHTTTGFWMQPVIKQESIFNAEEIDMDVNDLINMQELKKLKVRTDYNGRSNDCDEYEIRIKDVRLNKILKDVADINLGKGDFTFRAWINKRTGILTKFEYVIKLTVETVYIEMTLTLDIVATNENVTIIVPDNVSSIINYERAPLYTITYFDDGINPNTITSYKSLDSKVILLDPKKAGYAFEGWYREATFENQITEIASGSEGDIQLFAKWRPLFSRGNGTQASPFVISSKEHLKLLANQINSGEHNYEGVYLILENDLDFEGETWEPIGSHYTSFAGFFEGNNKKVSNFNTTQASFPFLSSKNKGLFGSNSGIIQNLGVENFTISNCQYGGGIAGYNTGTIINCYAIANIQTDIYCFGGLVGWNGIDGKIINSFASVDISYSGMGNAMIGGLAGFNYYATISGCYATGDIQGDRPGVEIGGLVGSTSGSGKNCLIENSYATGDITISGTSSLLAGGLIGRYFAGIVQNCYATGNVSATVYKTDSSHPDHAYASVGGLIGFYYQSTQGYVKNCLATGDAISLSYAGTGNAGGFIGKPLDNISAIANCYRYFQGGDNTVGITCYEHDLNTQEFFSEELLWDNSVWDFTNLDFSQGLLPKLK